MTALVLALAVTAADGPAVAPPPREGADAPPREVVQVLGSGRFRTPSGAWYPSFSPDGRRIVVTGWNEVRVLDARTGRTVWRADAPDGAGPNDPLIEPRFTPNGGVIVLAPRQQADAAVLDRFDRDGRPLGRLTLPGPAAGLVWAVSGDGGRVAAIAHQPVQVLRVYDARTGAVLGTHKLPALTVPAYPMALSDDGRRVALADNDTVRVFDADTGAAIDNWVVAGQITMNLMFTPDGGRVVVNRHNGDAAVRVRDLAARWTTDLPSRYTGSLAVTADGRRAVVGIGDAIALVDLASGGHRRPFAAGHPIRNVALAPDGRTLLTASDGGVITLWDAATGDRLPWSADPPDNVTELRFVGEQTVVGRAYGWHTWDAATSRPGPRVGLADWVGSSDLSPDGRLLLWNGGRPGFSLTEFGTGREVWSSPPSPNGASHMARFTADGRRAVVRHDQSVEVRDAGTGRLEKTVKAPSGGTLFGVSPDGRYALVDDLGDGAGNKMAALDLAADTPAAGFPPATLWMRQPVPFSRDGRRVAYVTVRSQTEQLTPNSSRSWVTAAELVVLEVGTWRTVCRVGCPHVATWSSGVALSADGRLVATAASDGATLWDADTGHIVRHLPHRGRVTALAFSPDGRTLAGAAAGGPVYLWDLTGRRTRTGPAEVVEPLPDAAAVRAAIANLATADPTAATETLRVLHAAPAEAVAALRAAVKPVVEPDPAAVTRWIAELADEDFATRERAEKELTRQAPLVADAARAARAARPTPERDRRLARVLAVADKPTADDLRGVRAVGVLARIGTPEAVAGLKELAAGAAGAEVTRSAADALRQLLR